MLSIIIPAHNAASTIERTIHSVMQNEPEAEIIVVENGSTDDTTETVKKISSTNIRLIHSGKGVSIARNAGIRAATGEWITFVDADDCWLGIQGYEPRADITLFNYYKDSGLIQLNHHGESIVQWALSRPTLRMTVWSKVFRKSFLLENQLFFNEQLWVGEDSEFLLRALLKSNAIQVEDMAVYRYCTDAPSVIRSYNENRTKAFIRSMEAVREDLAGNPETGPAFRDYVYAHINLIGVHDIYNSTIRCKWRERNQKTRSLLREKVISDAVRELKVSDALNIQRLPGWFFKMHAYSLGGLMCYMRSLQNEKRG